MTSPGKARSLQPSTRRPTSSAAEKARANHAELDSRAGGGASLGGAVSLTAFIRFSSSRNHGPSLAKSQAADLATRPADDLSSSSRPGGVHRRAVGAVLPSAVHATAPACCHRYAPAGADHAGRPAGAAPRKRSPFLRTYSSRTVASPDVASSRFSPSNVALYPLPLRCIVACHCHSIHSFTVQSHSGPRRSINLSLLPSDQHRYHLDRSPGSQCCSALDATRSSLVRRVSHALLC